MRDRSRLAISTDLEGDSLRGYCAVGDLLLGSESESALECLLFRLLLLQ